MIENLSLPIEALGSMVPEFTPEDFNYMLWIMLLGGFLSLTLIFTITKHEKKWVNLDIFSKLGVSILVGSVSYLVIIMGLIFLRVLSMFWGEEFSNPELNIYGFFAVILYSFFFLSITYKHKIFGRKGLDELGIIRFMLLSTYNSFFLYVLSVTMLWVFLSGLFFYTQNYKAFWLVLPLTLLFIYSCYSLISYPLNSLLKINLKYSISDINNRIANRIKKKDDDN